MKEIGGYFELELQPFGQKLFNENAIYLNSGRNAFEYIILSLPKVDKVWVPYYTCSSLHEPITRLGLNVCYYHINRQLEIENIDLIVLGNNDYLLYTNYFGVKNEYTRNLLSYFSDNLIVDNSQALFFPPSQLCFYSPRKFVGLPDGGLAFSPYSVNVEKRDNMSYQRCSHLLKRYDYLASEGYSDFKENSSKIKNLELSKMSHLTKTLFNSVDFEKVRKRRNENFNILHKELERLNLYKFNMKSIDGPLVYPFFTKSEILKEHLIRNKIYVATYWPNILKLSKEVNSLEMFLTKSIVALPIDQRYDSNDMKRIIEVIKNA